MPTQISDAQAKKLQNAALFVEASSANSFSNLLCDAAPQAVNKTKADGSTQTGSGAPCVRITDLNKSAGNEVTVDLFQQLHSEPTMGDDRIEGRLSSLKKGEFSLKIDQTRQGVGSGGAMTQQKTEHDLRKVAKAMLGVQYGKLEDQRTQVHLAGARGTDERNDWMIPVQDSAKRKRILVNDVTPPTFDRYMVAGNKANAGELVATDTFNLDYVDELALKIAEMANPLQPIAYNDDDRAMYDPLYVMYVTPRQWFDFWKSTSESTTSGRRYQDLLAAAHDRTKGMAHPLFRGKSALWDNILVKPMSRDISWQAGDVITMATDTKDAAGTTTVEAVVPTHRSILLGAQAIAEAVGKTSGGLPFNLSTEKTDHGNSVEQVIFWMNGRKKIRFEGSDGRVNDNGVIVLDTAVSA